MTETVASVEPRRAPRRRYLTHAVFAALVIPVGFILLEGVCSFGWLFADFLDFLRSRPVVRDRLLEERHAQYDPDLGWRHTPGAQHRDFYGPGADITITPDGFRGFDPVLGRKPPGKYRVVCLGDSFTMGYGVDDRQTYPALLQELSPTIQAINMGQGGYSVGQSYLWYTSLAEQLQGDVVVLAFILDGMLRLQGSRTENGYGKPVLRLVEGKIAVANQPVPPPIEFGRRMIDAGEIVRFLRRNSSLARTLGRMTSPLQEAWVEQETELYPLLLTILEALDRESRLHGRTFVVMLLPTTRDLPGLPEYNHVNGQYYQNVSVSVRQFAQERGILFFDAHPLFAAFSPEQAHILFLDERYHHYSPGGNALIARSLDSWLQQNVPGYPRRH